jgi:hypothetical protein
VKAIADTGFLVVTTGVTDFRVYRRGRREAIPLICPPGVR